MHSDYTLFTVACGVVCTVAYVCSACFCKCC